MANIENVTMAEQQLIGYAHAVQGYSLISMIEAMGLAHDEWMISHNKALYLPGKIMAEIDQYFCTQKGIICGI